MALPVPRLRLLPEPRAAPGAGLATADVGPALRQTFGRPVHLTGSGREALGLILAALRLRPSDEVWISTTLGLHGHLVSPCVTATVARRCRFAFAAGPRTAAALVIHDFGVPHPELPAIAERCRRHGWPLIEDAAHAFASTDGTGRRLGASGDFALFSLSKFFPLRQGGLLLGSLPEAPPLDVQEVRAALAGWLPWTAAIADRRRENWQALEQAARGVGLASALPLPAGAVPSLYLLRTPHQFATLARLRERGIETGPEQHRGMVFLPCHQDVQAADVGAMATAMRQSPVPAGAARA